MVHLDHGTALAALGQLREALAAFEVAVELAPTDPDAVLRRDAVAAALEGGTQ